MDVQERSGLQFVETAAGLLQRFRRVHPTAGVFEAADLQWWWRMPRATDEVPQLLWVDEAGVPAAAAVLTAWRDGVSLVPVVDPADDTMVAEVIARGVAQADELGLGPLRIAAAADDHVTRRAAAVVGLTAEAPEGADGWLDVKARPPVAPLADGYRLASRAQTRPAPHHFSHIGRPDEEERLQQTSLYRDDLDLVVLGPDGEPAAYALFWNDPVTRTGMVEPVRTHEAHQRRGLARHVLTAGIDRLAAAGAERVKSAWDPKGPAAALYTDVGFGPPPPCVDLSRPEAPSSSRPMAA